MMLNYCAATDKGGRKDNQDAYITANLGQKNLYLFAVADGVGGHAAGEIASMLAIKELTEAIKNGLTVQDMIISKPMKHLLARGFKKANKRICHESRLSPERYGMGTTMVAGLFNSKGKGIIANVGDSRAYLIGTNISRVTKDHSYVQELVDRGIITQEEMAVHPDKNIVTKIIGMDDVEPDFFEIELGKDILLLCSDGLTDALSDNDIKEIVIFSNKDDICKNLINRAKLDSHDNITIIAVKR